MDECIFCKIVDGSIPSEKVFENDSLIAIKDIEPVAPVHVLIIPKVHIENMNDITEENAEIGKEIFKVAKIIAENMDVKESGYRLINNCGENVGQTVMHLHYHLIGGKELKKLIG